MTVTLYFGLFLFLGYEQARRTGDGKVAVAGYVVLDRVAESLLIDLGVHRKHVVDQELRVGRMRKFRSKDTGRVSSATL